MPGPYGLTGRDGVNGTDGEIGPTGPKGERGGRGAPGPKKKGVVYTHWGKHNCTINGNDTEELYSGIVASHYYNNYGGGANYLCLPENDTEYLNTTFKGNQAILYGTEYESPIIESVKHNDNAPCAVCYTSSKSVQLMIPAKTSCPSSWTAEYVGYLMTAPYYQKSNLNYICVDKESESISDTPNNIYGATLYHVTAKCSGIPCPPYKEKQYITCVVCTK